MQGVRQKTTMLQKMQCVTNTSVSNVECYICGKGIHDGYSITAKTLPNGIVLFCDVHYPLQ